MLWNVCGCETTQVSTGQVCGESYCNMARNELIVRVRGSTGITRAAAASPHLRENPDDQDENRLYRIVEHVLYTVP